MNSHTDDKNNDSQPSPSKRQRRDQPISDSNAAQALRALWCETLRLEYLRQHYEDQNASSFSSLNPASASSVPKRSSAESPKSVVRQPVTPALNVCYPYGSVSSPQQQKQRILLHHFHNSRSSQRLLTPSGQVSISEPRPQIQVPPRGIGPIRLPNHNDVLCGRGGRGDRTNTHEGNIQFRQLVRSRKALYFSKLSQKLEKTHITAQIVHYIRYELEPSGRFLKADPDGRWYDIGDQKAMQKVGLTIRKLREDAAEDDTDDPTDATGPYPPAEVQGMVSGGTNNHEPSPVSTAVSGRGGSKAGGMCTISLHLHKRLSRCRYLVSRKGYTHYRFNSSHIEKITSDYEKYFNCKQSLY